MNSQGVLAAVCLILFGIVMAGFNFALRSMEVNFLFGFGSGLLIGAGFVFLLSRTAREIP